jgi:hypothetical protein
MQFNVSTPRGKLSVEFKFATAADLRTLQNWRSKASLRASPHVQDAIEYSRLAGKRWRTYSKSKRAVTGLNQMRTAIQTNPRAEIAFVLVAHAQWHSPSKILGFCFCRRTWVNHIVLDFAAAHPNAIRAAEGEVRGVGAAMIYSLTNLAQEIGVSLIWGEATENSAEFYRNILKNPAISDHFFISGPTFQRCLARFEAVKITEVT